MKFASVKTVGAACCLTLATGLLLAAQQVAVEPLPASSPAPPLGTPDSVKAEDYYKNIQVLKGIPANQIVPTMEYMRSALGGVRCQYCHEAPPDFEKDTKPQKETGRKMLEMVMAINKSTFNGRVQVTCYTCHRGSTDPVNVPAIPAPAEAANPAAPAAKPPALPTVETILSKYVDALGGEQAIRKVTSRVVTGTMDVSEVGGATGSPELKPSFELYEKAPNLTALFSHDPKWPSAEGYDGTTAWMQDAGGRVAAASGAALARAKGAADFYEALDLKRDYPIMAALGIEKVGDRDAYHVTAKQQGAPSVELFFDTQTGLLLRKIFIDPNPIGNDPTNVDYSDYQATPNGVKFPYTIRSYSLPPNSRGAGVTMHVEKIQENVPVDNSKFTKPAPKQAAGGN